MNLETNFFIYTCIQRERGIMGFVYTIYVHIQCTCMWRSTTQSTDDPNPQFAHNECKELLDSGMAVMCVELTCTVVGVIS